MTDSACHSVGNTPTDVGKTSASSVPLTSRRKHPHGRGEDQSDALLELVGEETPPRTWGRLPDVSTDSIRTGNTPTDVGKTCLRCGRQAWRKKHPHGRGEDKGSAQQWQAGLETPPRTWGRLQGGQQFVAFGRNTPTDVGKTRPVALGAIPNQKHPHGRGEDATKEWRGPQDGETPPRTW